MAQLGNTRRLSPRAHPLRAPWRRGVCLALLLVVAAPVGARAQAPEQLHAWLNAQRQANGIPPVAFDGRLADGCDKHNRYQELNGMGHGEDPGKPGYTPEGDRAHGNGEVVAGASRWSATSNPWDDAPLHLDLLMRPGLTSAGGAVSHGYACHRTGGYANFAGPTPFAYTGPRGRSTVPVKQTVEGERPYAPQQLVGIPQGQTTGYQHIVWLMGAPSATIAAAAITSSGEEVVLRVVDSQTRTPDGDVYGSYGAASGVLIPTKPLRPLTRYQAAVLWNVPGGQIPQTYSFVTDDTAPKTPRLRPSASLRRGGKLRVVLRPRSELHGRRATVTVSVRRAGRRGWSRVSKPRTVSLRQTTRLSYRLRPRLRQARIRVRLPAFRDRAGQRWKMSSVSIGCYRWARTRFMCHQ